MVKPSTELAREPLKMPWMAWINKQRPPRDSDVVKDFATGVT